MSHRDLPASDLEAVLKAVSRNGSLVPSTLELTFASGTDLMPTLEFTVRDKGGAVLRGEARFQARETGEPVILRLVYKS
ncbi:hypothetical protein SF23_00055 [Streptomyces sp. MBRL 10]|nr:hypothetical protein SF23_00055 [Streptomyces sp. MBRL 10]